jgi:gamma-glutamylcyclotransferase (GGCT)/AIG2-like uncharacterized protein YtfP
MNLFVYGTLLDAEVMRTVAGADHVSEPSTLSGYVRRRVSGEVYPAIVERPGASVSGLTYLDVSPASFARLDRFEGALYERRMVVTQGARTARLPAYAYVLSPAATARLSEEAWSLEAFQRDGKARFVRAHQGQWTSESRERGR